MAKQDVLDAINATIVPNGTKAINADSLRNLLTMMVENAGEGGSGEGALRVIVPELGGGLGDEFINAREFSPAAVEEFRGVVTDEGMAEIYEPYLNACEAAFAHNAEVYAAIKEKAKNGEGCVVFLDQTPLLNEVLKLTILENPGILIEYVGMCTQYCSINFMDITTTDGTAEGGLYLLPTGNEYSYAHYTSIIHLLVNPDGSIYFEIATEESSN